jgi:hypothetical protein
MRQTEEHYADFDHNENNYSDFTYLDNDGRLGDYLSKRGRRVPRWPGRVLTYYLEVKSTRGPLEEPFHLSNNQMDWAKAWTFAGPSLHVYIVLRVYDLEFEDSLTAKLIHYVDPWRMVCDGKLHLRTSNTFDLTPSHMASAIPSKDTTASSK